MGTSETIKKYKKKTKNKTKKNVMATILDNSFPKTKNQTPVIISSIYEKALKDNRKTEDKIESSNINKILKNKIFNILDILRQDNVKEQPVNDFYTYANLIWLNKMDKKTIDNYFTQFDNFRVVQDEVYKELIDYVKDYVKKNKSKRARELNNMYLSFLNLDTRPLEKNVKEMVER
jgi:hypothetical protein